MPLLAWDLAGFLALFVGVRILQAHHTRLSDGLFLAIFLVVAFYVCFVVYLHIGISEFVF